MRPEIQHEPAPGLIDQIVGAEVDAINERRSSLKRELLTVAGTGPTHPRCPPSVLPSRAPASAPLPSRSACCRH